jgi:pseudouridine kinase
MSTGTEVVIIGGANIDIKAKARSELVTGTSNPGSVSFASGGVARNVAHNLAQLGVPVALLSAVGDDAFGSRLIAETEAAGVDCSMVLRTRQPTGSYVAVLDSEGEMTVAVNAMTAIDALSPAILAEHEQRLASARLILADCNLPRESLISLTRFADRLIIEPVSVAKSEKARKLAGRGIFAITLNQRQAEHLCGLRITGRSEAMRAAAALHRQGFAHVILTLGRDGAVAVRVGSPDRRHVGRLRRAGAHHRGLRPDGPFLPADRRLGGRHVRCETARRPGRI